MNEQYVPFDLSMKLKKTSFDVECYGVYINGHFEPRYRSKNSKFKPNQKMDKRDVEYCTAPTWQQAFDWFTQEIQMHSFTDICHDFKWKYTIKNFSDFGDDDDHKLTVAPFDTQYLARYACLTRLLKSIS